MPSLTIAIPTFNRARALESQLATISSEVAGHESRVRVVVSDNCSSDETPAVCERAVPRFRRGGLASIRHAENIGAIRNICACIECAQTDFVWVIGDDDVIQPGCVRRIFQSLEQNSNLASLLLNFRVRSTAGETWGKDNALPDHCTGAGAGMKLASKVLRTRAWALAFMTAQVYRTDSAKRALKSWPEGAGNYDYQMYITAMTAKDGEMEITREPWVTYIYGDNVYMRDPRINVQLFADTLAVVKALARNGYAGTVCLQVAWAHVLKNSARLAKVVTKAPPLDTVRSVARSFTSLIGLHAYAVINDAVSML